MYIYADILIITNIYADFFLLKGAARLTHTPLRNGKCILGALVGSLFSLIIFLPPLNSFLLLLIRLFSALLTVIVAFGGGKSFRELCRLVLVFFFVCFVFAGIEYGLAVLAGGRNMLWRNSTLYVNVSLLTLVISTIIAYFALSLFRYFMDGKNCADKRYDIIICRGGKTASVKASADTCNNLADAFTGKPVIVCGKGSLNRLFGDEIKEDMIPSAEDPGHIPGWRLIPFSTIASGGMLPIFKPSEVIVKEPESGLLKRVDVYVGVADREMEYAVFNPKILK